MVDGDGAVRVEARPPVQRGERPGAAPSFKSGRRRVGQRRVLEVRREAPLHVPELGSHPSGFLLQLGRLLAGREDALADRRVARELLRDAHRVAVELLREVASQRRPRGAGEHAPLEFPDDRRREQLLLLRPLAFS